ncbi:MAG: hypothetical protein ABI968_02820, partial [Acidobacteriota bacterium]
MSPEPTWRHWPGLGSLPVKSVHSVAVDPTDDQTRYASVVPCCGFYKTTNGGDDWTSTGSSGLFLHDAVVDPTSPTNVYVLESLRGTYKTIDGGANWLLMNSGIAAGASFGELAMDPNSPATLYVTTQAGG